MKICFSILYIHHKVDFPGFDAGWLHCGVLVKRFIINVCSAFLLDLRVLSGNKDTVGIEPMTSQTPGGHSIH